jgi:deoxyribonuclease-1-like protein
MTMPKFIFFLILSLILCFSYNENYALFTTKSSYASNNLIDNLDSQLSKRLVSLGNNTLKIASWNIQDLGRSKNAEEINSIAKILRNFDLVAIQEVVAKDPAGAQAVTKIVDELNRMGSKWDYQISNPTKSPSVYMSERYAFLW